MTSPLSMTRLGDAHAARTLVLLHGILGSGGNLRGLGRRLLETVPGCQVALIDLPGHGDSAAASQTQGGPFTVARAARDVATTLDAHGLTADALIGHSFGGKVALKFAQLMPEGLRQVWALDSPPGEQPTGHGGEVGHLLTALEAVTREEPYPFPSREAMLEALTARGTQESIARWMTTNLRRDGASYRWAFDLPIIQELLRDYFREDMWPWLEARRAAPDVHLLYATQSDRYAPPDIARAEALPPAARVKLHALEGSGHWVHADNPEGLIQIMSGALTTHPA
ncbi:MAG: alpha/beta hydrolase [Polyangiaceae bacterium]|nr:alpha/beta hydrolase [Polyangiaceae bacterium]MCW5789620.1 alpha/beta hydrolase [Polyangiaceae bacterium]